MDQFEAFIERNTDYANKSMIRPFALFLTSGTSVLGLHSYVVVCLYHPIGAARVGSRFLKFYVPIGSTVRHHLASDFSRKASSRVSTSEYLMSLHPIFIYQYATHLSLSRWNVVSNMLKIFLLPRHPF